MVKNKKIQSVETVRIPIRERASERAPFLMPKSRTCRLHQKSENPHGCHILRFHRKSAENTITVLGLLSFNVTRIPHFLTSECSDGIKVPFGKT